jgi:hypothetical protein|tara:strand:- start:1265 stop:1870 length:606 start_codon:yes stop_codon:yes gene_type:complete
LQREGTLSHVRKELDKYQLDYENGIPLQRQVWRTTISISQEDFFDAKDIYSRLKSHHKQYIVRIGLGNDIIIYSNNREFLVDLGTTVRTKSVSFYEPLENIKELLKKEKDIAFVSKKPEFGLRVTLGRKLGSNELASWLKNNTDKSKIGKTALSYLEDQAYVDGLYFYVRDEKVLNLITLLIGDNIRRVQKLVWLEELDKY